MLRTLTLIVVLLAASWLPVRSAPVAPLQVSGDHLVAAGQTVHLHGINWGWWHVSGTQYTEDDMRRQAGWGANIARLPFSFRDLETNGQPGVWSEAGFQQMDEVVKWGARYHVYIVLDMHETPGGQNMALYDDGGGDRLWTDAGNQANFIALWQKIALRYRGVPTVAAYELLNEPETNQVPPDSLPNLCKKAVSAIRAIDSRKIIVLAGNKMSGPDTLDGTVYEPLPNILYTMHFYLGATQSWLNNLNNGPGVSGTQDWTQQKVSFTAPAAASKMSVMLRSSGNAGTAWFDDVQLQDSTGTTLEQEDFSDGPDGYSPERGPQTPMRYDPAVGHNKLGSLAVQGTTDYNGWAGPVLTIVPGKTYVLSVWVKLAQATGDTYLSAAFFSSGVLPKDQLSALMQPSVAFSQQYHVPVWVGEFGCDASSLNNGQEQWASDCISLFDQAGFDWTYWNFKETTDPTSMALQAEHKDGSDYPINQALLTVLEAGWSHL